MAISSVIFGCFSQFRRAQADWDPLVFVVSVFGMEGDSPNGGLSWQSQLAACIGTLSCKNPRKVVFFGVSKFESADILLEMLHLGRKQEKTEAFKPGRNAQLISGKGKSFSQARCEVVMLVFLTFHMALAMASPNCHSKIFTILRSVSKPRWSLRMFAEWFEVRFAFRCPRYTKSLWQRWGWLTKHVDQLKTTMVKPPRLWVGAISRSKKMVMISAKVCNQVQRCFPTFQRTGKERIPSPKALEEIFTVRSNSYLYSNSHLYSQDYPYIYILKYMLLEIHIFLFPSFYSQLSIHSRRSATSDIVKCVFKRFRKIQMLSSNWAIKNVYTSQELRCPILSKKMKLFSHMVRFLENRG